MENYDIQKLKDVDKLMLDREIDIEELGLAVRSLKNEKSPGPDGYTSEFYKFFWIDLEIFLL